MHETLETPEEELSDEISASLRRLHGCCEVLGEIEQPESDRATRETELTTDDDVDGGALTAVPQMTE